MFLTTPATRSVFTKASYVASNQPPAPAEGVIGSVPSPPVVAYPKHHFPIHREKNVGVCIAYARNEVPFGDEAYIIWISRSQKDLLRYRMLTTNDSFSTWNTTIVIRTFRSL
jgi:hypothetical protein